MYPSWGNLGGPRKQLGGGTAGQAAGFGGFEASNNNNSLFSSLQEQHLQQMQQLQMLHQKQLQSFLHQGNHANAFGAGHPGGYSGTSWRPEGPGHPGSCVGTQPYFKQDGTPGQPLIRPPAPQHGQPHPPPPTQPMEPPPAPHPPQPPSATLPGNSGASAKEANQKHASTTEDKPSPLPEQQQLWYKHHLQNLQKLRQENQKNGGGPMPPPTLGQLVPAPPPSEPPKGIPPPPPPKEEPPAPPPPPEEVKSENVEKSATSTDTPEVPKDPEEAARLQQLQAAAAQWQQVQQQRAGLQYQALMQQHEKLQQILEQYRQLIQQPEDPQSMSAEMQLRHYEMRLQQFTPLFQSWDHSFVLWHQQFQTYHHKDQLRDYELQWKQWQEQMNATNAHLQERVATLTAMVPFASRQYNNGIMGQYGQYPGQDMQMQQQPVKPDVQPSPVTVGPRSQGPWPDGVGPHSESLAGPPVIGVGPVGTMGPPVTGVGPAGPVGPPVRQVGPSGTVGPPVRGDVPTMAVRPPEPPIVQPPRFNSIGGPRGNNPRIDQPQQRFDGPPRFNLTQQRFDSPPRFDQPWQRFDCPPKFDQPRQHFDGPPRFDQPRQRFDGPPRFDQPRQHFDGPPRFDQPRQRFDGPPRFDQPRQRFDGPPRFDQPQQRFDGPPRFEKPRFGQQSQFELRQPGPPSPFAHPPVQQQIQQQGPKPEPKPTTEQPASTDFNSNETKTPGKSTGQPQCEKEKTDSEQDKAIAEDMTDDKLLGTEGFFVANDPIPQTSQTNTKPEDPYNKNASDNIEKPKPVNSEAPVTALSTVGLGSNSAATHNLPKPDLPLTNNKSPVQKLPEIKQEMQPSGQIQSRPDTSRPVRGRGQPPLPVQVHGRGRGQGVVGKFTGPNTVPLGVKMGETSYGYMPPEEDEGITEVQEQYNRQDPSSQEFGGEESEIPPEEIWMPEEDYFPTEEEYYEEPIGGPPVGRGGPSLMRGGPPMGRGGPPIGRGGLPMGRGGPPMARGGPPMGRGGPPMGRGGPPMGRGGPPMGRGGPTMGRGGPPMGRGRPPMGRGGPPMGRGGLPMGRGGLPMGRGGPPMGRGGPPMGRGGPPIEREEPIDGHWEESESVEYSEEVDPYWDESRPPMRGMRPPFPPGRGRPPHGHPDYMHQGRGRPPHPTQWPMDHGPLGQDMDSDDTEMDPARHPMYHGHDPHGYRMHPDVGRGRRRMLPPLHEMMDAVEERYVEGMERELEWQMSHGRGCPPSPQEIIDEGGVRRRPLGQTMARGMFRPGPIHEEYEERRNLSYVEDYGHGKHSYRRRPLQDYPPDDYLNEAKYYGSERDRERPSLERDFPPRMQPPEPYRDGHLLDDHPYPYDEHDRGRGELRIRDYGNEPPFRQEDSAYPPPPSELDSPSRLVAPPERRYPADYEDHRAHYEVRSKEPPLFSSLPSTVPATNLPESSVDSVPQGTSSTNVLALSQHQHEIILKAAQELKFIREMKEGMTPGTEAQPAPTNILPELPAGLLGLEIPPEVRNALKGMTAAAQTSVSEPVSSATRDYQSSLSAAPIHTVIPKTVDYSHGHEPGATVERMSYGERIVLRPDPMHLDRGYEKEPHGSRDPYRRDPYFERRSDPYMERREYSRERELYREMFPSEYERERFERERYPPRERDERSPHEPPIRSGYRERDRNLREKEPSGSRDRDEHHGRPGNDRPPYERSGVERSGPERFGHSSSPYVDRRSHPEERGPPTAPPLPPPPQPPPRVEKKPEFKNIDDILKPPGRLSRPERIVIIMRGLPGSGKSHVAKLIRDKEVDCGGAPPRVLGLDDYFMTEVEKVRKDPDSGRGVKSKVLEYEYEPEMEDTYRSSMLKTFKKTLDDGFFPFIILDTVNDRVKHFDQFWSAAKTKGFEVYVAEITADTQACAKRNVHGRTLKDIMKMYNNWESLPRHMVRLDVRSLLQDAAIEEVEMEDFNPEDEPKQPKGEDEEEGDLGYIPKSKWEMDTSEAKLDRLDGLGSGGKRKREDMAGLDHFLQLPDDYATRLSEPGKKRVRWADLEEQKEADRKRAIGFVVGQTDWERITDGSGQLAQRALNRTKYF